MALMKKTSKSIEKAQQRAAALASIDPNLDLGNGLTLADYVADIEGTQGTLDDLNRLKSEHDAASSRHPVVDIGALIHFQAPPERAIPEPKKGTLRWSLAIADNSLFYNRVLPTGAGHNDNWVGIYNRVLPTGAGRRIVEYSIDMGTQ